MKAPAREANVFTSIDPAIGCPHLANEDHTSLGTGKTKTLPPQPVGGKDWPFEAPTARRPACSTCALLQRQQPLHDAHRQDPGAHPGSVVGRRDHRAEPEVDKNAPYVGASRPGASMGPRKPGGDLPGVVNFGSVMVTAGNVPLPVARRPHVPRDTTQASQRQAAVEFHFGYHLRPAVSIDGKQYVAVVSGWARGWPGSRERWPTSNGWEKQVPEGGSVWPFALDD